MQLADTLAVDPVKPQGMTVPRRITVVENQEDCQTLDTHELWSAGWLHEVFAWTDVATSQDPIWERLIFAAPQLNIETVRSGSYLSAWQELTSSLQGISLQVVVNTPRIEGFAAVDFFHNIAPDMAVVVHLYTQEYFDYYREVATGHPTQCSAWLDVFRHAIPGSLAYDWSEDQPQPLAERFAAGQLQVSASRDHQAAQEVYLLNRRPGQLTSDVKAFVLPRLG